MKPSVLLVDDDELFTEDVIFQLGERFHWDVLNHGKGVVARIADTLPDVVLLDIELGDTSGLDILSRIRAQVPRTPVIMITRYDPEEMAAHAWRLGAFGYIEKASSIEHISAQIERAIEEAFLFREKETLRQEVNEKSGKLMGKSPAMKELFDKIAMVAKTSSTVLITGETGTGKELVAREIHNQSGRSKNMFVPVLCSAIPDNLAESELFGHEKGAFTGAIRRKIGKFELAQRGTIFLDEVSEMDGNLQAKLLRVLQDNKIQRVGGSREIEIDVRVIAATNRDLRKMVDAGKFREDLYYRLRVIPVNTTPLREKREDIPLLAQSFLNRKAREMKKNKCRLSSAALSRLMAWDWPGNVRELENVLEYALVHLKGEIIGEELIAPLLAPGVMELDYKRAKEEVIERFEKNYIRTILNECSWNVSEAARRMGITRQGLDKMMKRRGIVRPDS